MKKSSTPRKKRSYTYEFRLKCVRLCLEENYPRAFVAEQSEVSVKTLAAWIKRYNENGEAGLKDKPRSKAGRAQVHAEVKEKIIEIKKEYPVFGIKKISDILKRIFFLKASPETVRQTLQKEELIQAPRKKPRKNPQKPRFFERSRPNQMWQTDIFSFRLGGQVAYLLGYIDDYSRYIVGMGLYRKQTAENLLEVYRQATGESGCPAEMLTDNGRQYTNWRGVTRFEKQMKTDRVKHIKSQPHHPQTLGKTERFWKTIWTEFLDKCQFDSLETARERIALWIKYYNYRRPHQGIGGLCPADRYFEIATDLRKIMEKNIEENILEQALKGRSPQPFYMVGRMNGQSIVLHAEKGKMNFSVDGEEKQNQVFDMEKSNDSQEKTQSQEPSSTGESSSRTIGLDGKFESERSVQVPGDQLSDPKQVAGSSDGSYVESLGASQQKTSSSCLDSTLGEPAQSPNSEKAEQSLTTTTEGKPILETKESSHGRCSRDHANNHTSSIRVNDRRASRQEFGDVTADLLQMGEQSPGGNVSSPTAESARTPEEGGGSREGETSISSGPAADEVDSGGARYSDSNTALRRDPRWRVF